MDKKKENNFECFFCKSTNTKLQYANKYHKFKPDHGPINFHKCYDCQSGLTFPLPSLESLSSLYASFSGGMSKFTRDIRDRNSLHEWYEQCVNNALKYHKIKYDKNSSFKWIDVGAGNGEIAKIMSIKFPNSVGVALDYHKRPMLLNGYDNVAWLQCDLNRPAFEDLIIEKGFDIAFSITVLEHVISPYSYMRSVLKLLNENGSLYLTTPDNGSIAAYLLGKFWPYLIFGEHLSIPSKKGMKLLYETILKENLEIIKKTCIVRPVILPYPINYYLDNFHLGIFSSSITKNHTLRLNTGILEASIH